MSLFRQLLPHHCPLCLNRCQSYICQHCIHDLQTIKSPCYACGLPLSSKSKQCGDCLKQPKPYTQTITPLLYQHPLDHLIHSFKTSKPQLIAQQLAPFLQPLIDTRYQDHQWPDALIPVPLHWMSKFKRGFNQAQYLAEFLSRMTGIPCTPIVKKRQRGLIQKSLTRKRRLLNSKGCFECCSNIEGKHLVVIDDVVTSCATVIHMTNTLLQAGAKRVDVWALARTPAPRQKTGYKPEVSRKA